MAFICPVCDGEFTEKRNLVRHLKNQHGNLWSCHRCSQSFNRYDNYEMHDRTCHFKATGKRKAVETSEQARKQQKTPVVRTGGALEDTIVEYRHNLENDMQNATNIFDNLKIAVFQLKDKVQEELVRKRAIKMYVSLHANFHLSSDETFITEPCAVLNTDVMEVFESSMIDELLNETYENLVSAIENYQNRQSGWVLDRLLKLDLHVLEYSPLHATSYIPLPQDVYNKKAVINIKNTDEKCFLWSVIAGLYGDLHNKNHERVSHYTEYEKEFNLRGISFPMALKDIPKFERQNNVSVSVYGYQDGKNDQKGFVYALKVSKEVNERHVNLLLISNDETNHYCYIKDFNRLVSSQYSNQNNKTYFCRFCLHGFSRSYTSKDLSQHRRSDEEMKKKLKEHEESCFAFAAQRIEFPEDPIVKFKNIKHQLAAPFVVYADFESILRNLSDGNKYQEHIACSYAYHIVSNVPGIEFDIRGPYIGVDAVEKFLDNLQEDLNKHIMPIIENNVKMIWDDAAKEKFISETHCHICEKELDRYNDIITRDHCHFTGAFRGPTHQHCNLVYKMEKSTYKLPIVFHNLRGYDAHLIFQKVKRKHGKIDVIPNNSERYISFTVGRLKFIDSMQFLSCKLEKLASQLNDSQFINLQKMYSNSIQRSLLTKKGIYCYDYMNSMERFDETSLPDKKYFYNRLNAKDISKKEYKHAQAVWDTLGCNTMRDYHNEYLTSDVLLLADVFENFRKMSKETYGLDPIHYYSLPGLSWDAMLKYTGVELDLVTDIDMYQMVEKGIRGGISQISHRYATTNHPSMASFNPKEEMRTLTYQDANALYSWAMSQLLPLKNFKWVDPESIDVLSTPDDYHLGYILEVDLEYPESLHELHNDYPLAPEHVTISHDMLSPFQRKHFPPTRGEVRRLVANLNDKEKYVIHYRNLKLYVSLGMVVKKVHRVIQFDQSCWMKPYIDLNTEKRKEATRNDDEAGKDLFKLMMNAVFGKTMENLRKRINFEIVTSRKIALKRIAKPNFKREKKFREDLVGIHMSKPTLLLNRPIQVGFAILDISKYHMFNFHYNVWIPKFPNSRLLFTDTDSLAYEVTGHDLYVGMGEIKEEFDFSEYPEDHALQSFDNMKKAGKFKDECKGQFMLNFVGLRPKLYSFDYKRIAYFDRDEDGEEVEVKKPTATSMKRIVFVNKNTAKGIKESVASKLTFDDYEYSLRTVEPKQVTVNTIRSDHHNLYSLSGKKIALSACDIKRWIWDDGIHTYAHGHWKTKQLHTSKPLEELADA